MHQPFALRPPFFEIGPKTYVFGEKAVSLAIAAERASLKYGVQVIFTPQYCDIERVRRATKHLYVFAQHMDALPPGRGLGSVLAEAVKCAGADGVMLNHAECPVSISQLNQTIKRADGAGLATVVCADTIEEAAALTHLRPNVIVAEPSDLIGTGEKSNQAYVIRTIKAVKSICPEVMVLQGAGIRNGNDVYEVMLAGAEATGSTSGIMKAADPEKMIDEMLFAVRRGWDDAHRQKQQKIV